MLDLTTYKYTRILKLLLLSKEFKNAANKAKDVVANAMKVAKEFVDEKTATSRPNQHLKP